MKILKAFAYFINALNMKTSFITLQVMLPVMQRIPTLQIQALAATGNTRPTVDPIEVRNREGDHFFLGGGAL